MPHCHAHDRIKDATVRVLQKKKFAQVESKTMGFLKNKNKVRE